MLLAIAIKPQAQDLETVRMNCKETYQRLRKAEDEAKRYNRELTELSAKVTESGFSFIIARVAEVVTVGATCFLAIYTSRQGLYTQVQRILHYVVS